MGKHKGGLPGTQIETESSNQGGGSIANTQDLKGRVSVVVIDVLPNDVLVLEVLGWLHSRRKLLCCPQRNGSCGGYWLWF